MTTLITVIHVTTCILLVLVVMIQSGKGAEISASLGGSSQTVFGSSGGANFFTRFTNTMAFIFMTTSLLLTVLGSVEKKSVFDTAVPAIPASAPVSAPASGAPAATAPVVPAAPAAATAPEAKK